MLSRRRRSVALSAVFVGALLACCLGGCSAPADDGGAAAGVNAAQATAAPAGQAVYRANCATCHGDRGQGHPNWQEWNEDGTLRPPPLNGDGHTWHHADGVLYRTVRNGGAIPELPSFKSGMPAFGATLSHQEIVDALTYVKSLWGDKAQGGAPIRETQANLSEEDPFPPGGG